jgi:hypothetical protein
MRQSWPFVLLPICANAALVWAASRDIMAHSYGAGWIELLAAGGLSIWLAEVVSRSPK